MTQIRALRGGSRNTEVKGIQTPVVSIITVCYNSGATLGRTIASLVRQSDQRFEYIIVDGGSEDGTREILKTHDSSIDKWISEKDVGIYDAMNKGAGMARGRFIAFLNADDRYLPKTIETVIKAVEKDDADVYHGNMNKERVIDEKVYMRLEKPNPELMPKGMGIFHPSSFVRASRFREIGGFDIRYKLAADYDLFLKLWLSGSKFQHIDEPLSIFSLEGASNAGCGTYAEAVLIQKRQGTGTHGQTRILLYKCRMKKVIRQTIFSIASFLGLTRLLESRLAFRWK